MYSMKNMIRMATQPLGWPEVRDFCYEELNSVTSQFLFISLEAADLGLAT